MLAPIALIPFLSNKLRVKEEELTTQLLVRSGASRRLTKGNTLWRVVSRHRLQNSYDYRLRGIDNVPASESMMEILGEDGQTRSLSVAQWFAAPHPELPAGQFQDWFRRRGCQLQRPDLPCALLGPASNPAKIRIPLELLSFKGGQTHGVVGQPQLQSAMITQTCAPPQQRLEAVGTILSSSTIARDDTHSAFKLQVASKLEAASGRVLEPMPLLYKTRNGRDAEINVPSGKGDWNLRGAEGDLSFRLGGSCKRLLVAICAPIEKKEVEAFLESLRSLSLRRGMKMGPPPGEREWLRVDLQKGDMVESLQKACARGKPDLLICILPDEQGRCQGLPIGRFSARENFLGHAVRGG